MIDDIIETYKCIISCRRNLPGISMEQALCEEAINNVEKEYQWILNNRGMFTIQEEH